MKDSDSSVQRYIENIVLRKIGLESRKIKVEDVTFNFDGYSERNSIIAEIYSGIKTLKSAQRQKISQDILKMILYEKMVFKIFKKKIVVIDNDIYGLAL
ncbi:MAG: hypothetical protein L3J41_15175 [Melioribacteraceae bacterium]|nr:hypothetical protein [Melioribacteraceae bacterium]